MSRERAIQLGRIKANFTKLPLPDKFSRIVLVVLNYVDRQTYLCWPSKARIAKQVGCSEKCVSRNLKAVKQLGLFSIRTLGANEMRQTIGDRFKSASSGQRLYSLFRLNPNHSLWKGQQIEEARQVIREATYAGVTSRKQRRSSGESVVSDQVPSEPTATSFDPYLEGIIDEVQIGTGPSF